MPPALRMGAQGMGLSWERFPVPGMGCSVLPRLQQPGVCDPVCSLSREAAWMCCSSGAHWLGFSFCDVQGGVKTRL